MQNSSSPANAGEPVRRGPTAFATTLSGILDRPLARAMTDLRWAAVPGDDGYAPDDSPVTMVAIVMHPVHTIAMTPVWTVADVVAPIRSVIAVGRVRVVGRGITIGVSAVIRIVVAVPVAAAIVRAG